MESDWKSSLKEINGINLANYFPHKRSFNSVVFIHKKYLDEPKPAEEKKEKVKAKKEKKQNKNKQDKCQQFSCDKITEVSKDHTYKLNNDSVLDHTIRFAKNIVPLVIPPSEDKLPVFYTIKTSRKHKKKDKKPQEPSCETHDVYERDESKKVIETYRKVKKESFSVRESASHSSSNTLDDLNINQSLCCTFSEMSEKKYHKKERNHIKKQQEGKFTISESFEAIATETPGDSRIKIHLMNDKDKNFLSDSIKIPVLNAIKDCIAELNNSNSNTEITSVQKIVKYNTQKLDNILDKLTCIERKLDAHVQEKSTSHTVEEKSTLPKVPDKITVPKVQVQIPAPKVKAASKLEELGEDLIELQEDYSSEEELHQERLDRGSKSIVTDLMSENKSDRKSESLAGGEITGSMKVASSSVGIKTERPNRIPARFCWTDAARK